MTVAVAVAGTQFGSQTLTNVKINVLQRVGTFTGTVTYDAGDDNAIVRSDGSNWIADGFLEGQWIRIAGGPNAGDYKIALIDGPDGAYAHRHAPHARARDRRGRRAARSPSTQTAAAADVHAGQLLRRRRS